MSQESRSIKQCGFKLVRRTQSRVFFIDTNNRPVTYKDCIAEVDKGFRHFMAQRQKLAFATYR